MRLGQAFAGRMLAGRLLGLQKVHAHNTRAIPPRLVRTLASSPSLPTTGERHRVLILGGGTAGVGTAAQLKNAGVEDICIVEPSDVHYYQPGWTFVGAGIFDIEATKRTTASVIPEGVRWIQAPAAAILPEDNKVTLAGGENIGFDYLIVATGVRCDWEKIPGLTEALEKGPESGVCSNYHPKYAPNTWATVQRLSSGGERGNAIFTQPAGAVKCGGAPQKIMWMTEDHLRKKGKRENFDIHFALPLPAPRMFGVNEYNPVLNAEADARGVKRYHQTVLVSVDAEKKEATFREIGGEKEGTEITMPFAMLHVTPPMSVPEVLKESTLLNESGFVDVDKATLQHKKYPNVFALGDSADASALPTSKTMAAVAAMAPVVTHNLQRVMQGKQPSAEYDGYSSCPIPLSYDRLLLTEFIYGPKPQETFTGKLFFPDQGEPSKFYFWVKQHLFPYVYWTLFPRGKWFGRQLLTPFDFSEADAKKA
ncbi:hypothetical protein VYU27_006441 [Nannochloropsis oceanica]